jgi:hypothetical protein
MEAENTHKIIHSLKESGFSGKQSVALVETMQNFFLRVSKNFATKDDLKDLRHEIDSRFSQVDKRFIELEGKFDKRFVQLEGKFEVRFKELQSYILKQNIKIILAIVAMPFVQQFMNKILSIF